MPFSYPQEKIDQFNSLIGGMRAAQAPQEEPVQRDTGPFTGIFEEVYNQAVQDQEKVLQRREEASKRLARGHALNDAFRVLTQGISAGFGASVPREAPNQLVNKALDEYLSADRDRLESMERWRMMDLNTKMRELGYLYDQQARREGYEFQEGMYEKQQEDKRDIIAQEQEYKAGQNELDRQARMEQIEATQKGQLEQVKERGKWYTQGYRSSGSYRPVSIPNYGDIPAERVGWAMAILRDQFPLDISDTDAFSATQKELMKDPLLKQFINNRGSNLSHTEYTDLLSRYWDLVQPQYDQITKGTSLDDLSTGEQPEPASQEQPKEEPIDKFPKESTFYKKGEHKGDKEWLAATLNELAGSYTKPDNRKRKLKHNKFPARPIEEQLGHEDRVGMMMRAFRAVYPDMPLQEIYEDVQEYLREFNDKTLREKDSRKAVNIGETPLITDYLDDLKSVS